MLPSLGFNEILILGVLALVVIGPKDLPLMLRKLGRWTAKLRGMAQEFRTGFDELARQAELDELKKEVDALRRTTNLQGLANEVTKALPTLEDYAGVAKPKPLPAPEATSSTASASMEAPPIKSGESGGEAAPSGGEARASGGSVVSIEGAAPQSAFAEAPADSSPIEGERRSAP